MIDHILKVVGLFLMFVNKEENYNRMDDIIKHE